MAGLPNYSNNPVKAGNYLGNGDNPQTPSVGNSMEVALATKMQLILDQPMADVDSGLTNRDFEGDFFKIGDSVALVKPNADSLTIEFGTINEPQAPGKPLIDSSGAAIAANTYNNKDARLIPGNVTFSKTVMTINKYAKYAFYISDFTEAEGKWNYESGNLDLAAQEMRKKHNLETVQMVVDAGEAGTIETLGSTAAAPIYVKNGDELYEKVIVKVFAKLYDKGAITADGQITYGSNAQEGKSTHGQLFLPTDLYTELLVSKYLQDRSTVAADEKVETGKVKTVMGLDVAIEPSLNPDAERPVILRNASAADDVLCIVAGTRNLITKAGKVLPPDKFRSHKFFADEYHGVEIYGKQIVEPKAGVCVFVKVGEAPAGES